MNSIVYDLKKDAEAISRAIEEAFSSAAIAVDEIVWNPLRGGLVNNRFAIHSIRVSVADWQKTVYRIESGDMADFASGKDTVAISHVISELVDTCLDALNPGDRPGDSVAA